MLKLLIQKKADGVIIHKIDRSARNLRDWADLGELIDRGIGVHFANESLDLHTRGGRLSADIQAVVAADYIRNLREETRKGFYGRVKQGLYPLPAPLGYVDCGKGKPKQPDPAKAGLVRHGFELYSTARYTLDTLAEELYRRGLRNRTGGWLSRNGLSILLNNPFYMGLIRLRRTGEMFPGIHEPLISKALFERVQEVLAGKVHAKVRRHDFLFRRLLTCRYCRRVLVGESQKGHTYYRCHTGGCVTKAIREEAVADALRATLSQLILSDGERAYALSRVDHLQRTWELAQEKHRATLSLSRGRIEDRLRRVTDAYLDGVLERELFLERKEALLLERRGLQEREAALAAQGTPLPRRLRKFLELAGSAYSLYETALPAEKRELLQIVSSNRLVEGKRVDITLAPPFNLIAERASVSSSSPYRDRTRTWDRVVRDVWRWLAENPAPWLGRLSGGRQDTDRRDTETDEAMAA